MPTLRYLTDNGIGRFAEYLDALVEDPALAPPVALLDAPGDSAPVEGDIGIERRSFRNKLEMATCLAGTCPEHLGEGVPYARGIWTWLTLLWIDQVLPADAAGARRPNKPWYYIPADSHYVEYRHLLMGPYRTFRQYGEAARLLLSAPLSVWSDVEEQLAGKREFLRLPGALAAADLLYFDRNQNRPRRGITNRRKAGNVRRLREVVKQFNRTYDLHSMSGEEVLSLLPSEFDRYRP